MTVNFEEFNKAWKEMLQALKNLECPINFSITIGDSVYEWHSRGQYILYYPKTPSKDGAFRADSIPFERKKELCTHFTDLYREGQRVNIELQSSVNQTVENLQNQFKHLHQVRIKELL